MILLTGPSLQQVVPLRPYMHCQGLPDGGGSTLHWLYTLQLAGGLAGMDKYSEVLCPLVCTLPYLMMVLPLNHLLPKEV